MGRNSIGWYDATSMLTFITRQQGKLWFHMGLKYRTESTAAVIEATRHRVETLTGQNVHGPPLYPEEVYYLLQRHAIQLFSLQSDDFNQPHVIGIDEFHFFLQSSWMPHVLVYAHLKANKFHPRRHFSMKELESITDEITCLPGRRDEIAYDVYKSYKQVPGQLNNPCQKADGVTDEQLVKRLHLVFRVLVYRFEDAVPSIATLQYAMRHSDPVPLKVAVVHQNTILFHEISITP
ncbi:unnamed protein product [Albugo candida]|uniref:Uncharacterized protein n=1 Tax=Albugo candida TaxID=65357 RepID=A0A024GLQ7_9STRA|nr:unnamed protein product [Albugo candida]|eukprot:CCI47715.1 unnamed protein product [Albugo candida]